MEEIIVGSAAFFDGISTFEPKTIDKLSFVDSTRNGWWRYVVTKNGVKHYKWQRHTLTEYVNKLAHCTDCKRVTTLLVPAFVSEVKGSLSDSQYIAAIESAINRLCERHAWGKTVYQAYVANGSLTLTEEQRATAYALYEAARRNDKQE